MAKTITPAQKMEQKIAAQKEIRKNHFMPISVMAMLRQPCFRVCDQGWKTKSPRMDRD
jgi:hypothetical protein